MPKVLKTFDSKVETQGKDVKDTDMLNTVSKEQYATGTNEVGKKFTTPKMKVGTLGARGMCE